ncbi:hypothetical protein GCM10010532_110420 [Dactylosporangium siamense]|uniref:Uncharacterized protein n=1 Tax=Dactylosporangium siamense TaxID=685454 RepID=A0A919Q027_9ACTN|nr:hypothetical protein Dsi01nite_108430 [Dactylosporangium siamense]
MAQQQDLPARPRTVARADLNLGAARDPPIQPDIQQQLDAVAALHRTTVTYLEISQVGYIDAEKTRRLVRGPGGAP